MPIPQSTEDKCIECGYPESKHGDNAECDCCDKIGNLEPYLLGNNQALLTRDCIERERILLTKEITQQEIQNAIDYQKPELQEQRLLVHNAIVRPYERLIAESRKIDEQLHLSSDIFTAKTVSIDEIRKAIWVDAQIPQDKKFFEFVAECKRRINHFQSVIFDLDKQKIEAYSEQKAWHVAMNDYANKLRTDEREQLKIQDITYDVKMPKPVTPRAIKIKTANTKEDKIALRNSTSELNKDLLANGAKEPIPEFIIATVMTSKNWTLEQAINHFRRSIKEGLSEQPKNMENTNE